jgi:hypothetical protein
MNPAADPASLPRVEQLRYLAFDGGRTVAALNRTCYLTLSAIAGLEGETVKNPIFLVIASLFILVAIAGLAISSARLIGLFG